MSLINQKYTTFTKLISSTLKIVKRKEMITSLYQVLSNKEWLDVDAFSVTDFLNEHQKLLREEFVSSSIKTLREYEIKGFPKKEPVPLLLGYCKIEVENSTELTETIEALENVIRAFQ